MRAAGISFGQGATLRGHIPASLGDLEPLAGDASSFAGSLGVDPSQRVPAFGLVGRVMEAGHFEETCDALSAPFHVPGITDVVRRVAPEAQVDARLAALVTLTSETGLAACDPDTPHVSPVEIKPPTKRLQALGHPAAGSIFVVRAGLPLEVALMVGNRHSREPTPISHGVGGLTDDLRATFDVAAASLVFAEWENGGRQPDEADHVYQRLQLLFDDEGVYGKEGGRRIVESLGENYELSVTDELAPVEQPVTWGVGIQTHSGDITRTAFLPQIGSDGHRVILPLRGNHLERLHQPEEDRLAKRVLESAPADSGGR